MRVRVTPFRQEGRRLSDREIANAPALEGDLMTSLISDPRGHYSIAELKTPATAGGLQEVLAKLYEPQLIQILADSLLLRGIEKNREAGLFAGMAMRTDLVKPQ